MGVTVEAGAVDLIAKIIKTPVVTEHDVIVRRLAVHAIQVTIFDFNFSNWHSIFQYNLGIISNPALYISEEEYAIVANMKLATKAEDGYVKKPNLKKCDWCTKEDSVQETLKVGPPLLPSLLHHVNFLFPGVQ